MPVEILTPANQLAAFYQRARLAHAQDPDRPDRALCGFPVRHALPVSPESSRCVVCDDLAHRPDFVTRG